MRDYKDPNEDVPVYDPLGNLISPSDLMTIDDVSEMYDYLVEKGFEPTKLIMHPEAVRMGRRWGKDKRGIAGSMTFDLNKIRGISSDLLILDEFSDAEGTHLASHTPDIEPSQGWIDGFTVPIDGNNSALRVQLVDEDGIPVHIPELSRRATRPTICVSG